MKNLENQIKGNAKKNAEKEINLENLKFDLSKGRKDLLNKESQSNSREIYKGMDNLNSDDKKKKRSKIRRDLKNFRNDILGKDRSDKERENAIKSFMQFYKENWKIQDFKIENFSNAKNEIDLQDNIQLLDYLKSVLA